jgi:hypothetical protein
MRCSSFRTNPVRGGSRSARGGFAQTCPERFEDPALGGYNSLKVGATFRDLRRVPLAAGGTTDLTRYPARAGFEDLVMLSARTGTRFGWTAVTFPQQRYVWFALKNPAVLASTVLWHSNGGRHYAPWSGRHRGVLGLEDVTSYFHFRPRGVGGAQPGLAPGHPDGADAGSPAAAAGALRDGRGRHPARIRHRAAHRFPRRPHRAAGGLRADGPPRRGPGFFSIPPHETFRDQRRPSRRPWRVSSGITGSCPRPRAGTSPTSACGIFRAAG